MDVDPVHNVSRLSQRISGRANLETWFGNAALNGATPLDEAWLSDMGREIKGFCIVIAS